MSKSLYLKGKKYISATRAAEITGYTGDYVGQLCRAKKISASLVGRSWYVLENEILNYKEKNLIAHKKTLKTRKLRKGGTIIKFGKKRTNRNDSFEIKKIYKKEEEKDKKLDISNIRDVASIKPLYYKDNKELFPVLKKKFDVDTAKYIALDRVANAVKKTKQKSGFEKFIVGSSIVLVLGLLLTTFIFEKDSFVKLANIRFGESLKSELSLASSVSASGQQTITGWVKDVAYKIIKPWLSENKTILVSNLSNPPYIKEGTETKSVEAKTVYVSGTDKNYVDAKILELRNYFLAMPFFSSSIYPNVNRYYITNQNDRIVDTLSRSSGSSSSNTTAAPGATTLSGLTDITLTSSTYGDLIMYDGSSWINVATSSLGIVGITGQSIEDLSDVASFSQAEGDLLQYSGGNWTRLATSTDGLVLKLNDGYPEWMTDLTGGGDGLATSTAIADTFIIYGTSALTVGAEATFNYDDATNKLTVPYASTTAITSEYASSTSGYFGNIFNPNLSAGFAYIGSNGKLNSTASSSINLSSLNNDLNFITGSYNGFIEVGTTSVNSIQTLSNLSITESQISDLGSYLTSAITAIGPLGQTSGGPTTTFASSTTGTDFTVTGSGDTITFNLPTASSANRGLLSSTDWTTFNNKVSYTDAAVNLYIHSSSTIPKIYTDNTWTGTNIFGQATSTNFAITSLGGGGGDLKVAADGSIYEGTDTSGASWSYPFTAQSYGMSTTSTLGLLNGFFSTASSTISSSLFLPSLSQGFTYIGSDKMIRTAASSSLFGFTPYSDTNPSNFITSSYDGFIEVGTTSVNSIQTLSNLSITKSQVSDFGTYENPLTFTWPLIRNTNTISWDGLSTSSAAVIGNIPYFSGVNTFANVATGTISVPTGLTSTTGRYVLGGNLTIGLDTGYVIPLQTTLDSFISYAWPFTVATNYVSTSTTLGLLNGFFTNSSSTITELHTGLSDGFAYIGSGRLLSTATSSIKTSEITNDANFITDGNTNWDNSYGFLTGYDAWTHPSAGVSATTSALAIGTTSPFAKFSINSEAGENAFVVGSSTMTSFIIDANGNVAIGTSSPSSSFMFVIGTSSPLLSVNKETAEVSMGSGDEVMRITNNGFISVGTTTASYLLTVSSASAPQLSLSAGAGIAQWVTRNAGGNLYFATTTIAGTATTSISAFEISGSGFGTTTVRGLNISGQATTTSNVGINLSAGCFAVNGTCMTAGTLGALTSYDAWSHPSAGYSATTSALAIGTSSAWAKFSVSSYDSGTPGLTNPLFVVASSTGTSATSTYFTINSVGNVGIGTTNPGKTLDVVGTAYIGSASVKLLVQTGSAGLEMIGNDGTDYNNISIRAQSGTQLYLKSDGNVGISTTTPQWLLNPYSSTAPQLSLSAGAGIAQWVTRNAGGNLYFATTTIAGTATTSISAFEISGSGFGTTTVRGLNISGQATTTSNVGINLSAGCFAINGTCVGGGTVGALTSYDAWTHPSAGYSATTSSLVIGASSTPTAKLTISNYSTGTDTSSLFTIASSTLTSATSTYFTINSVGNVGIGTTSPYAIFSVSGVKPANVSLTNAIDAPPTFAVFGAVGGDTSVVNPTGPGFGGDGGTISLIGGVGGVANSVGAGLESDGGAGGNVSIISGIGGSPNAPAAYNVYGGNGGKLTLAAGDGGSATGSTINWNTGGNGGSVYVYGGAAGNADILGGEGNVYLGTTNGSTSRGNVYLGPYNIVSASGSVGISTLTPQYQLTISSSTASQLSLSAGADIAQWAFRNAGGNFYLSTTTIDGTATTSISALEISGSGFGTTTVRGLNISGQATTTSNVGINLSEGCFAIDGVCVGGGTAGALTSYDAWTHPEAGQSATTSELWVAGILSTASSTISGNFYLPSLSQGFAYLGSDKQLLTAATSSLFGYTPLSNQLAKGYFIVGDDAGVAQATSSLFISSTGLLGIGTTTPLAKLNVYGGNTVFQTTSDSATAFSILNSATSSVFSVATDGFGTTTVAGLNISGSATTTSNVGINLLAGCFAIDGVCVGGGTSSGLTSYDAWTHSAAGYSATTSSLVIGASSSPFAKLSVSNYSTGTDTSSLFTIASSTLTSATSTYFTINSVGNVGIGTSSPYSILSISSSPILGSVVGSATKQIENLTVDFNPSATLDASSGSVTFNSYASNFKSSLDELTLGDTGGLSTNNANVYGSRSYISGSPTFNDTNDSVVGNYLSIYGSSNEVSFSPTLTSVIDGSSLTVMGNYSSVDVVSAGDANLASSVYGLGVVVSGNLTTTGLTNHSGLSLGVHGTADTNYGIEVSTVQNATNNYGIYVSNTAPAAGSGNYAIYSNSPAQSYFSGNIGIGTTTPLAKLNVYGGNVAFQTTSNSATAFQILNAATSSVFTVATDGFGTTTVAGLNISGSATTTSNVGINLSAGCYAVNGTCIGGVSSGLTSYDAWTHPSAGVSATTSALAIGTTSPFAKFSINSEAGENAFVVGSSTMTSFIIDTNGNVAIGTSSPSSSFMFVIGTSSPLLSVNKETAEIEIGSGDEIVTITNGGLVGIASSTPWTNLDINGTIAFSSNLSTGSGQALNIDSATFEVIRNTSSMRYKDQIEDIELDTSKIYELTPRSFTWASSTASAGRRDFGLVAEEVYEILPELTWLNSQGQPEAVRYDMLSVLLLGEMQKQKDIFASSTAFAADELISELSFLSDRVSTLEASSTEMNLLLSNITEGLVVKSPSVLSEGLKVDQISSIGDYLQLISDTEFIGRPYFTTDTAGFAIVKKGAREVEIVFEREYLSQPIVNATISFELASSTATSSVPVSVDNIEEKIFADDVRFLVTKKSEKSFTIILSKPAVEDIPFGWTAIAVKGARVFESVPVDPMLNTGEEIPSTVIIENPNSQPSPETTVGEAGNTDVMNGNGEVAGVSTTTEPIIESTATTPETVSTPSTDPEQTISPQVIPEPEPEPVEPEPVIENAETITEEATL